MLAKHRREIRRLARRGACTSARRNHKEPTMQPLDAISLDDLLTVTGGDPGGNRSTYGDPDVHSCPAPKPRPLDPIPPAQTVPSRPGPATRSPVAI
jgi:hypothetical protein